MRILKIGEKEYKVEFSFEAAEYKNCVDTALQLLTGAYIIPTSDIEVESKRDAAMIMLSGTANLLSSLPSICATFFYAGLLENNPVDNEKEAKVLIRQFIKENPEDEKASYMEFERFLLDCMEDDGFFKLTGLDKMVEQMNQTASEMEKKDHPLKSEKNKTGKRKLTSTK